MNDVEFKAQITDEPQYGVGDASYQAAGGETGIRKLVDAFYDAMERLPEAEKIRKMHPADLTVSRDKLTLFLCGWLNGPALYSKKYGPIRIPQVHSHLEIGPRERDAWLQCMQEALKTQPYPATFKKYLLEQLYVPAERSRNRE
ncbi:MAG: group II truncated hemoglobin [Candidatus Competibacteraceae bacterium]|nr:group II truncated hemoglobin [Candidatus Competibacteraceae bacterium]MCB1821607.1 group II truncated hemoglobin [Candidatus Competibacteraceae bacterium]